MEVARERDTRERKKRKKNTSRLTLAACSTWKSSTLRCSWGGRGEGEGGGIRGGRGGKRVRGGYEVSVRCTQ